MFAVPLGQTLPEGVSIDGFGILHVSEDARLDQTVIRVCVRQLNVNDSCQNIGLNQRPPLAPGVNATAPPPAEEVGSPGAGGGNVIVPLAIAGGAGFGTWMILDKSGLLDNLGGGGGGSCISDPQLCCEFLQWRLQLFGDDQRTVRLQWHTRWGRRELRQRFGVQERPAVHQRSV